MRIANLEVTFHRTVRVADGRTPSNLPPSLGHMKLYQVSDHRKNCPKEWADGSCFMALHETEAMWMSFHAVVPCALLVGAGGINALTGEKLGTKLAKDNYLVTPPQPWLDGWKDKDGTVYQFVATPHKKGEGITVGEQLIGKESKTGAIGIAVYDPKDPAALKSQGVPWEGVSDSPYSGTFKYHSLTGQSVASAGVYALCSTNTPSTSATMGSKIMAFDEMGIGRGGKIYQKIYPDPHGLEAWQEKPSAVFAVYLVDAKTAAEITGEKVQTPVGHEAYGGVWFGLKDQELGDVSGSTKFSGLKSAAFPGDKEHAEAKAKQSKKQTVANK